MPDDPHQEDPPGQDPPGQDPPGQDPPDGITPDLTPDPVEDGGRPRRPRSRLLVGVLTALLGLGAVTQLRAEARDDAYAGYRQEDLVDVLTGLTQTGERAEAEIARLRDRRAELLDASRSRAAALEEARQRARDLQVLAGTTPVTGPGVRITVTDPYGAVSVGSVLDLVEELRTSLAEAVEIDDAVRVVASSAVGDTADGLVVDGKRLSPPYVVEAIGEPATLEGGLTYSGGPIDNLEDEGAEVSVEVLDRVDVRSVVARPGSAGAGVDREGG